MSKTFFGKQHMTCCDNLIHPFQNDTGTSQRQRVIDELLSGTALIDARKTADLLQYISQLSRHINFYDNTLALSDWQPFFSKSLPFVLARIIKYDKAAAAKKMKSYEKLFRKKPSRQSLQLITHFIYYQAIYPINRWYLEMKGTELPAEKIIEKIIRDKLQEPVKKFVCLTNIAVQKFKIKKINFDKLSQNDVWEFSGEDIRQNSCLVLNEPTRKKRLIRLENEIVNLFPGLLETINLSVSGAELSLDQSILPLKEEFREQHSPHLALLFAFLKLFSYFQNDLNGFTKKHLDFFYKDVLQLKPRPAVADQAHILFEIQNQLDKYRLIKSTQVRGGKDKNKVEINFATDDEIVVNRTVVAETKTLFLNNHSIRNTSYLEGAYIAPNSAMADGIEQAFADEMPKNWPTLGSKFSKYTDPEKKLIRPYPDARLGFILASPVLLLNEGARTVDIQLACKIDETVCDETNSGAPEADPCCNDKPVQQQQQDERCKPQEQGQIRPGDIINYVNEVLSRTWRYISQQLIDEAVKKGISSDIAKKIRNTFLIDQCFHPVCCDKEKRYFADTVVWSKRWNKFLYQQVPEAADKEILNAIFPARHAFKIYFSGEKEWVEPSKIEKMELVNIGGDSFVLHFKVKLENDKPAVTFYDKNNLNEDFNTTQPLVKIELDNELGIILNKRVRKGLNLQKGAKRDCCLYNEDDVCLDKISLYQFFRYARVIDKLGNDPLITTDETRIDVLVCGIKKFLVKNSESVQNPTGPVYVFGTNPEVIDFDPKNQPAIPIVTNLNLIGPSFYLGSAEIFYKKWNSVYLNFDWKDRPTDFVDYYKAYFNDGAGHFGLDINRFYINLSVLERGKWISEKDRTAAGGNEKVRIRSIDYFDRRLFHDDGPAPFCDAPVSPFPQTILLDKSFFNLNQQFFITKDSVAGFGFDSLNGFMKINLQGQDFYHNRYSYVLARQMMALGKLPDDKIEDAVYYDATLPPPHLIVFSTDAIKNDLQTAATIAGRVQLDVNENTVGPGTGGIRDNAGNLLPNPLRDITNPESFRIREIIFPQSFINPQGKNLTGDVDDLVTTLSSIDNTVSNSNKFQAVIPNPPWTPISTTLSLDYTATAPIQDIELIHLYPYKGTYKHEEITLKPTLFPTFCDEGNLFIGLDQLVPGSTLDILFQLAEATADSESQREELSWYYLDNNIWKSLRNGFEVLNDATDELTTSGIIKFAMPANMTKGNSILPKDYHWIRVSIPRNSRSVAETIGIHTQAVLTTFTNEAENDKSRLDEPLAAGSISKLTDADPQVKTVTQPYDSFGGREPEAEKHFYLRASELLRHKGRAIQKWDYERLVLEGFPQIFKVKCINHSFALDAGKFKMDFPIAPGYVVLALIPDLTKLKAGNSFEPKAPVSLLEQIEESIRNRTSPFVRLRAMNPRYEKIHFCLKVKLVKGKDEIYYKEKLQDDIREFLAPWSVGDYSKLSFGQCVNRSDLLRFLEGLDYIDYIVDLKMRHERDDQFRDTLQDICPATPRSILLAGIVDVCIRQDECDEWGECYEDLDGRKVKVECCTEKPQPLHDFCKPQVILL